jgi:hypothetical protein
MCFTGFFVIHCKPRDICLEVLREQVQPRRQDRRSRVRRSGSALADIAGLGAIDVAAMRERGYPLKFEASLSVVPAVTAPIMPPSIAFIVYASMGNASVPRMFRGSHIRPWALACSSSRVCPMYRWRK